MTGDDAGCRTVSLVVNGKSQPALGGAGLLQRAVLAIAGIRWQ